MKRNDLTDATVKSAKPKEKNYTITDGEGMHILVKSNGRKYWRLAYKINTRKTYAIGVYPSISLKEARIERDKVKKLVSKGIDPVQHRQMIKASQRESFENSFENVALEWLAKQKQVWTPRHAITVEQRLRKNLLPWIGNRPISEITAPELLKALRRVEARGAVESAHRSRTIAGRFLDMGSLVACAIVIMRLIIRDALQPRTPKKMAAITDPIKVGGLMRAIDGYQGDLITRCALKFSALTFCRPGEIRHAEWTEIIWAKEEWVIPAEKMKMKRDHVVPLADQAIMVLQELHPMTGSGKYVFPSLRTQTRCMSENTVNAALRRIGIHKNRNGCSWISVYGHQPCYMNLVFLLTATSNCSWPMPQEIESALFTTDPNDYQSDER